MLHLQTYTHTQMIQRKRGKKTWNTFVSTESEGNLLSSHTFTWETEELNGCLMSGPCMTGQLISCYLHCVISAGRLTLAEATMNANGSDLMMASKMNRLPGCMEAWHFALCYFTWCNLGGDNMLCQMEKQQRTFIMAT